MKLKQIKKQHKGEKLSVVVDAGTAAQLASLTAEFERGGYDWDFEKPLNRWIKGFADEAGKAIRAQAGTTNIAAAPEAATAAGSA